MRSYTFSVVAGLGLLVLVSIPASAQTRGSAQSRSSTQSPEEWLTECRRERDGDRRRERVCEVRTEAFRAGAGALRVNASPNGGVIVESWSGDQVEVQARIQATARTRDRAAAIVEGIDAVHDGNSLSPDGPPAGRDEGWSVVYVVKVPRSMDLELRSVNGPVSVRDVRGHIDAQTTNGPITLVDVAGDVTARATNGPVTVRLSGPRWEGSGLDAQSTNGPVTLSVPAEFNAELEVTSQNGPLQSDLPLRVTRLSGRGTNINTTIGAGGAPVRVATTNGPITIHQR